MPTKILAFENRPDAWVIKVHLDTTKTVPDPAGTITTPKPPVPDPAYIYSYTFNRPARHPGPERAYIATLFAVCCEPSMGGRALAQIEQPFTKVAL